MTGDARRYRLNPPDRTGWLLGLGAAQLAVTAAGLLTAVANISVGGPLALSALIAVTSAVVALGRVGGVPLVDAVPSLARWVALRLRRRQRWFAPLPLLGADAALPPALDGQRLLSIDACDAGFAGRVAPVAVVHDRRAGTVATTLRVSGGPFTLQEPAEQDYQLQRWADAFAGFCRPGCVVRDVRWSEWAAPGGLDGHTAWLSSVADLDDPDDATRSYLRLLETAGPLVSHHDVLVTLSAPIGAKDTTGADRVRVAVEGLLAEARLFGERLAIARLATSGPLTPAELAEALRARLDPAGELRNRPAPRSLAARARLLDPVDAGPLATETAWSHWRVDATLHRAFYVSEWPRTDVAADWLGALLQHAGPSRSVTVAYQPIDPAASRRAIARQAAKIESDADTRAAKGLRVGAEHHRAHQAVLEREAELVSGFGELAFAGVVTVCAASLDELERAASELVNVAAAAGLELRDLHGRHDLGVGASLPLARGLAPKGLL